MLPRNSMRGSVHSKGGPKNLPRNSLRGSVHSKKGELGDSLHSTSTIGTDNGLGGSSHSKSKPKPRASMPPQKVTPAQTRILRSSTLNPACKSPGTRQRSPKTPGLSQSLHAKPRRQPSLPLDLVGGRLDSKSDHLKPKPRPEHGGIKSLADAIQDTDTPKSGPIRSPQATPDDDDSDDDSFAGDEEENIDAPSPPSDGQGEPLGKVLKCVPMKDRNNYVVAAPLRCNGHGEGGGASPDDAPSPASVGKGEPLGKPVQNAQMKAPTNSNGDGGRALPDDPFR